MTKLDKLQNKEISTVNIMIKMYCHKHHDTEGDLCEDCRSLLNYSRERIIHCPLRIEKPVCGVCSIHCFKPEFKSLMKIVMRYSGPRMIIHHPILTIQYLHRKIAYKK